MAKINKILTAISLVLVASCSTKYDEVAPDTVLKVSVINESNSQPLRGAVVYVYDNESAFKKTIASVDEPSGFAVSYVTNDTGQVVIPKLKTNVQYFVYAYYKDSTIVAGTYITLDNSAKQYELKNILTQSSITTVTIPVRPSDGFVVFWTAASNAASLPIAAFIGSSSVGTVTQSSASGVAFQSGSVTARARAGQNTVEGESGTGCVWVDGVNVIPGSFSFYPLSDCGLGTAAFYTDNVNAGVLPIRITINANDNIGSITSVVTSTPPDCAAANLTTAFRTPGGYTYEATSTSGNCVWTGTFVLDIGSCNLIYLDKCN